VKNKVAPPFRMAEFDIMFVGKDLGISRTGDILDLAVDMGIVKKLGAFFSYGEQRLGQGRENAKDFLRENPELTSEIEAKIRTGGGNGKAAPAPEAAAEEAPEATP
jgi:recA bacterial DNA recombination protein.